MCRIQWRSNCLVFFFKQTTAYGVVSRYWSSEVCSSDLLIRLLLLFPLCRERQPYPPHPQPPSHLCLPHSRPPLYPVSAPLIIGVVGSHGRSGRGWVIGKDKESNRERARMECGQIAGSIMTWAASRHDSQSYTTWDIRQHFFYWPGSGVSGPPAKYNTKYLIRF